MSTRPFPLVCLSLLCLAAPHAGRATAIRYEISPRFDDDALRLQVQVSFRGDADGLTEVALPFEFGSATGLFRCIRIAGDAPAGSYFAADSSSFFVQHAPGQAVTLRYEVLQDFPGDYVSMRDGFRPVLRREWFHVLGNCLFLVPRGWKRYEITLDWRDFPADWTLHNSFGSQQRQQYFECDNPHWLESVFVGGDFRVLRTEVFGQPVYLALRGHDWAFADTSLLTLLHRTVALQRDFWRDRDIPYYTVTLLPLAPRPAMSGTRNLISYQYLGMGLTNSFAAFATPTPSLGLDDLCHLFHHELMHDWIGCKIRNGGASDDMRFGWFSEGFTEYFAYKNMLKGGFITPEQYVERLNFDFIEPLYTEPMGAVSNNLVAEGFFHCPDIAQLPYRRGCVFAFYLDNAIKKRTNGERGLHDFMLEMLDFYYEADRDLYTDFDFFLKNLSRHLGSDAGVLYDNYILRGQLIPLEAYELPPYWKIMRDTDGLPIIRLDQTVDGWREGMGK